MDTQEGETSHHQKSWKAYREKLYRFVRGRVDDDGAAEDIVHNVLAKAYTHRDTLRADDKIRPWLYQIARNAVIDYYRERVPMEALPEELAREQTDAGNGVMKELTRCVMPLIGELPTHYRQALILYEFEGLKQREIAAKLGLTVSGAKSRVQRGRKLLETELFECCRFEIDARGGIMDFEPKESCNAC